MRKAAFHHRTPPQTISTQASSFTIHPTLDSGTSQRINYPRNNSSKTKPIQTWSVSGSREANPGSNESTLAKRHNNKNHWSIWCRYSRLELSIIWHNYSRQILYFLIRRLSLSLTNLSVMKSLKCPKRHLKWWKFIRVVNWICRQNWCPSQFWIWSRWRTNQQQPQAGIKAIKASKSQGL